MNENWAGNSTSQETKKGLRFRGCSRGVCSCYVRCWKYCSLGKKTHWLSSGSQIFFYLDVPGQSSKWEGQLLGSAKHSLIPSTCNLPPLFSLSYWVQEGVVRMQIKQKISFTLALCWAAFQTPCCQSATLLWWGAAMWLAAAISWHHQTHVLSSSPVIRCPFPLLRENTHQKMELKPLWHFTCRQGKGLPGLRYFRVNCVGWLVLPEAVLQIH